MKSHALGKSGEEFAEEFLTARGYSIVERNYQTKSGEIDIIAREGSCTVFIEVKTRTEQGWDALEAVHPRKQRTMYRVALAYLVEQFGTDYVEARFDVLGVYQGANGELEGRLIKNAFWK